MRRRWVQARMLLPALGHATHWAPVALFGAAGVAAASLTQIGHPVDAGIAIDLCRRAGVLIAIGAAFVVDDPAAVTIASVPPPLAFRRTLAIGIPLATLGTVWGATLAVARVRLEGGSIPLGWLTLEFAAEALIALAIAAAAITRGYLGAPAGAVGLPVFSALVAWLPDRWTMLGGEPGSAMWSAAHARWAVALGVAFVVVAASSIDPARRLAR